MTDDEIISFLKDNPIEITNNFITSGRHRVSAMCGRMIKGKKYLPLYVKISFQSGYRLQPNLVYYLINKLT